MIYLAAVRNCCSARPAISPAFLALFTLLAGLWWRWRAVRAPEWAECSLLYEEAHDTDLLTLGLRPKEEDAAS